MTIRLQGLDARSCARPPLYESPVSSVKRRRSVVLSHRRHPQCAGLPREFGGRRRTIARAFGRQAFRAYALLIATSRSRAFAA